MTIKKYLLLTVVVLLVTPWNVFAEKASTEELIASLKSEKSSTREKAAKELGERGEKLALQALVETAGDKDKGVQMAVVQAIAKINDPGRIPAMCEALRRSSGDAQKEAMHLLTENYVQNYDRDELKEMWKSMGELFDPPHPIIAEPWIPVDSETIETLIYVLDDKDSENRIEAAATLGILRSERALPRLQYYLRSPNQQMVRTCVRAIGYIGDRNAAASVIPLLQHGDREVVIDAIRVLGQFRYKEALPELHRFVQYNREDSYKRIALQAISRIGDPSSEEILKGYYSYGNKDIRQYSIEGLGRMKLGGYLDPFKREYQNEKDRRIKLALAFSLFQLGDKAYIETIVQALPDRVYRNQAREYLIELGPAAVPHLANYLKSEDKELRVQVIRVLGDMHQPEAIGYLEPYIQDKDIEIAQVATDAIRELKSAE